MAAFIQFLSVCADFVLGIILFVIIEIQNKTNKLLSERFALREAFARCTKSIDEILDQ